MRINVQWVAQRGPAQPIIHAAILDESGAWHTVTFVVDTGAEVTVIRYQLFMDHGFEVAPSSGVTLVGVGGNANSVPINSNLLVLSDDGQLVPINGPFHASTDPIGLDDNLLGRDVLSNFAVIVDRPGDQVMLLARDHGYQVVGPVS